MKTHELKTWPKHFEAVISGDKTFELRRNDRKFKVGDNLSLREFKPKSEEYTGRIQCAVIVHIVRKFEGLAPGFVILGIERKGYCLKYETFRGSGPNVKLDMNTLKAEVITLARNSSNLAIKSLLRQSPYMSLIKKGAKKKKKR